VTRSDLFAVLPLLVLAATILAAVIAIAVRRSHGCVAGISLGGLAAMCATLPAAGGVAPRTITALLVVDSLSLHYLALVAAATAAVAAISYGYLNRMRVQHPEEFYVLLLSAALGSAVLVSSRHFASLFLGLETLSVSLYALIGYRHLARRPVEAGVKYLVLAAVSSAFLLLGGALIYTASGSLDMVSLTQRSAGAGTDGAWLTIGAVLIMTGLGFKLAVVPFHMWTPDVYEGAPAPAAAFVAAISKGAVLGLTVRVVPVLASRGGEKIFGIIAVAAVASMVVGNLLALLQPNLKRLLAYSSIAHMGYALVALLVAGAMAQEAVTFYLIAYAITIIAAFAAVAARSQGEDDCDRLEDYRGLFWRRPGVAAVLTAAVVSLAGLPPTIGFMGKYVVVAAGIGSGLWLLVLVLAATSVLSLYYYLRVVVIMAVPADHDDHAEEPAAHRLDRVALAVLMALIVGFGLAPGTVLGWLSSLTVQESVPGVERPANPLAQSNVTAWGTATTSANTGMAPRPVRREKASGVTRFREDQALAVLRNEEPMLPAASVDLVEGRTASRVCKPAKTFRMRFEGR